MSFSLYFCYFVTFLQIHITFTIRENINTFWRETVEEGYKAIKGARNRLKIEKDVWRKCMKAVFLRYVYSDIACFIT